MNVTGVYPNDAMLRQISEGIKISNVDKDSLINSKNEWNYFQIPRAVITQATAALSHRDEMSREDLYEVLESVDLFNVSYMNDRRIFNGGRLKRIVDRNIYRTPANFRDFIS